MTASPWRPPQAIRVKVVGLARHAGRWLMMEVLADDGSLKGFRPPGGSVEFGEARDAALEREWQEEFGVEAQRAGEWRVFENIFRHEDAIGHEIIFAAPVRLAALPAHGALRFAYNEAYGGEAHARWAALEDVDRAHVSLYPDGIADWLKSLGAS